MTQFNFQNYGIADLIRQGRLTVPPNQRSYAWGRNHVQELLEDLHIALSQGDLEEYFLGTVVLVNSGIGFPQIADGQQRIATTSIIMARIRDLLNELKEKERAQAINEQYIRRVNLETANMEPHLQMNIEDNEFYRDIITQPLIDKKAIIEIRNKPFLQASNRRLLDASECVLDYLRKTMEPVRADLRAAHLIRWVTFLQNRATVAVVTVADEVGAYRIFETLNDRGLKASQADILKNYLFSKASVHRVQEAHALWNAMNGTISTLPDNEDDDNLVSYIRYFWIVKNGLTRHKELAKKIRDEIKNEPDVLQFLFNAKNGAVDYTALWMPTHSKWSTYKSTTRHHLYTLFSHLKVEQIIPLILAVAIHFSEEEADKAFKLFVSWSVRFLISGGTRGGRLEKPYADQAQYIGNGTYTKAKDLREAMKHLVPNDKDFEEAFAVARVSKGNLARYYLRSIDKSMKNDPEPEYVANEDEKTITLEHVMPFASGVNWDVDEDTIEAGQKMLGNMVLLRAKKNVLIGNSSFDVKRETFRQSSYAVTQQVATYRTWGLEQIKTRQVELAKIAVKTWTLDFKAG